MIDAATTMLIWSAGVAIATRTGTTAPAAKVNAETAQRLLPLAVLDIVGREEGDAATQRLATIRSHEELFTYVVRNERGAVLLQSHAADLSAFPL